MRTILASKEKGNLRNSSDESRISIDSDEITLDLEVTESGEVQRQSSDVSDLQDCEKKKDVHNDENKKNVYDIERHFPPPYVVWVQFMGYWNNGEQPPKIHSVDDPGERNSFVRKVFFIVLVMLLMTAGVCAVINLVEPVKEVFVRYGFFFMLGATFGLLALSYLLDFMNCTRQAPCSYICLLLAVIFSAVVCVFVTIRMRTILIYYALAATVVVVALCFLLACSKFDFTKYMLFIVMMSAAVFVIFMLFLIGRLVFDIYLKPFHIAMLTLMTLLNVVALAMELQLILGGRTIELGVEEYAIGAFMVYMSIIDIFIKLLILSHLFDS